MKKTFKEVVEHLKKEEREDELTASPVERLVMCDDLKFTEKDMLWAFRHGREFEQTGDNGKDMPPDMPDKNLPFWEWLKRNYT